MLDMQDLILGKIENVDVFNHQLQEAWLAGLWWLVSHDLINRGFAIAPLGHIPGREPFQSDDKLSGRFHPRHFDRGLLDNIFDLFLSILGFGAKNYKSNIVKLYENCGIYSSDDGDIKF